MKWVSATIGVVGMNLKVSAGPMLEFDRPLTANGGAMDGSTYRPFDPVGRRTYISICRSAAARLRELRWMCLGHKEVLS
jgi:hypothetical protein